MSERNKLLARRAVEEVWNRGNFGIIEEIFAADYAGHQPGDEATGQQGVRQYFGLLREAFPDIHFTIEDQFAEDDRVVTRWSARATHQGTFKGIPATGKRGMVTGITINRIANDKIVEGWTNLDSLGMMQQLGLIPVAA